MNVPMQRPLTEDEQASHFATQLRHMMGDGGNSEQTEAGRMVGEALAIMGEEFSARVAKVLAEIEARRSRFEGRCKELGVLVQRAAADVVEEARDLAGVYEDGERLVDEIIKKFPERFRRR